MSPSGKSDPAGAPPSPPPGAAPWTPEFIAQVRARVPYRACTVCGQSIGAARLTWLPDASTCAWCAGERLTSARGRPSAPG